MRVLQILVATMVTTSVFCQSKIKFGEVTVDELKMSTYEQEPTAAAVILYEKGYAELGEDLTGTFRKHVRIKFFNNEAIDDWATFVVYLERSNETISKLKGITYNLENGVAVKSEMEDASIFKTRVNKYLDQVKFTLPNVKPGSVIEYSYSIRTGQGLLPPWEFQHLIPTAYSEFETSSPNNFTFRKDMQGYIPISKHATTNRGETWIIEHAPALKVEPFMSNPDDYVSRLDFYLTEVFIPGHAFMNLRRSWPGIAKEWAEDPDFGAMLRGSGFLKKTVEELTTGISDPKKKVEAIYAYVKSHVEWNEFIDRIPDHAFKKVLEEKKGSSSEINMLLTTMLQKADIDAEPVLISTRSHGRIRPFLPMASQFDDVICMVTIGEKSFFLDGTDKNLPMQALPQRCLNGEGLVVSKDKPRWVPISCSRSRTVYSGDFAIEESGELKGTLSIYRDGSDAGESRKSIKELGQQDYVSKAYKGKGIEVDNSKIENLDNAMESLKEAHEVVISDQVQDATTSIFLNPIVIGKVEENPFRGETRNYPIDFPTSFERFHTTKIKIPSGFEVEELPKQKVIMLPENGGKFSYSATIVGDVVTFVSIVAINKTSFETEEFPYLKEFYDQVIAKQNEQVVFKRK